MEVIWVAWLYFMPKGGSTGPSSGKPKRLRPSRFGKTFRCLHQPCDISDLAAPSSRGAACRKASDSVLLTLTRQSFALRQIHRHSLY